MYTKIGLQIEENGRIQFYYLKTYQIHFDRLQSRFSRCTGTRIHHSYQPPSGKEQVEAEVLCNQTDTADETPQNAKTPGLEGKRLVVQTRGRRRIHKEFLLYRSPQPIEKIGQRFQFRHQQNVSIQVEDCRCSVPCPESPL